MGNKISLKLEDVKIGMILGEDLFDNHGRLMFSKNLKIDSLMIKKINELFFEENFQIKINSERPYKEIADLLEVKSENKSINAKEIKNTSKYKQEISREFDEFHNDMKSLFIELEQNNSNNLKDDFRKFLNKINNRLMNNALITDMDLINEVVKEQKVEDYLFNHSVNVAIIGNLIGKWLDLGKEDIKILTLGGLVHDIGKLKIDKKILDKPEKLTEEEFEEVKKHPSYSHKILTEMGYNEEKLLRAVTLHHEREDGTGYPLGIKSKNIPIHSKIIAIADIFDAMTSNRVYDKKMNIFKVMEKFQKETFGKLDYKMVTLFIKKFLEFYIGSEVTLNTGDKAKILNFNSFEITKPILMTGEGKIIDTSRVRTVEIVDY
ncbi:MAG: HD-GYP domain-containing protein [Fusobacteriaceae bacterium]|nr:HD-GYP domain-containing protein [Fusobacteriaceae bacterium]